MLSSAVLMLLRTEASETQWQPPSPFQCCAECRNARIWPLTNFLLGKGAGRWGVLFQFFLSRIVDVLKERLNLIVIFNILHCDQWPFLASWVQCHWLFCLMQKFFCPLEWVIDSKVCVYQSLLKIFIFIANFKTKFWPQWIAFRPQLFIFIVPAIQKWEQNFRQLEPTTTHFNCVLPCVVMF